MGTKLSKQTLRVIAGFFFIGSAVAALNIYRAAKDAGHSSASVEDQYEGDLFV